MEQHIKIIGIIDIVLGALSVLGGLFLLVAFLGLAPMVGAGGQEGAAGMAAVFASIGLIGGIIMMVIGGSQILVGVKLQAKKPWARVVQIVLGVLALPGFPIGTAFGVYCIWAMTNKDTAELFK